MLKKAILILFLFLGFKNFGQNPKKLDSLLTILDKQKEDTNKVNTLIYIQDILADNQSNKKLEYLLQAELLAKKLKSPTKEREIYTLLGSYYGFISSYEKSLEYNLKSAKLAEQLNQNIALIRSYLGIGQAFLHVNDQFLKAKAYLDKAELAVHTKEDSAMLSYIIEQKAFWAFHQKTTMNL